MYKKTITTILATAFLLSPLSALAFTSQQITDNNPAILPDNPFYAIKSWTQGLQDFFISNPVKKTMFNVYVLNQKGAELAISIELGRSLSEEALNEYAASAIALTEKIAQLTPAITNDNIGLVFETSDQLVDYLLERTIVHIQLQEEVGKLSENDSVKMSTKALVDSIPAISALDSQPTLNERIMMVAQAQDSDFALQFIDANLGN